jgi:enterochelin esterase-like enzyme
MSNQNGFHSVLALALLPLLLSGLLAVSAQAQQAKDKSGKKGGAANRPEPQWVTRPVQAKHLQQGPFDSKAACAKVSYLVYLPPSYETTQDRRYPVVYWLHGIGDSQQGVPRFCERVTKAIEEGKAPGNYLTLQAPKQMVAGTCNRHYHPRDATQTRRATNPCGRQVG